MLHRWSSSLRVNCNINSSLLNSRRWLSDNKTKKYPVIQVLLRNPEFFGSRYSRRFREMGRIPGVIYGKDKDNKVLKILVTTDLQDVLHEISERQVKFETTTYEVVLKNDKGNEVGRYICVPRDTAFSSMTGKLQCVNFMPIYPGIRMKIPVNYVNEELCDPVQKGAAVVRMYSAVKCVCEGDIPEEFVFDLTNAKRDQVYRTKDIVFPPKVRPAEGFPEDQVFLVVQPTKD